MPHVLRDASGKILAVLDRPSDGGTTELPADHPDLVAFLARKGPTSYFDLLRADLEFIRVIEDLIGVLLQKNVLLLTDLPPEAQEKLLRRGSLRRQFRDAAGGLVGEEEDVI
jgi:hypothetical protein